MQLEIRHLRLVIALARAGSISAVAHAMETPQPSLSRQLRRIESAVGYELFTRSRTGVAPTPQGVEFLRSATAVVSSFDGLLPGEQAPGVPDPVRVATYCLPIDVLVHQMRDDLGVRTVRGTPTGAQQAVDGVADGLFDLAGITVWPHTPEVQVPDGVRRVTIATEEMAVMLARDHPSASRSELSLTELGGERWVARSGIDTTTAECARAGVEATISHYSDDHGYYLDLVGSGMCVAFCSPTTHTQEGIVVRPYHGASTIAWELFFDPTRLGEEKVQRIVTATRDRRRERLAR